MFKHRILVSIEMHCGMQLSTQLLLQKVKGPLYVLSCICPASAHMNVLGHPMASQERIGCLCVGRRDFLKLD